jgi:YVTN family beta-propeller protein
VPVRRPGTRRFLATVLFTDIVGSTERAAGLGDRAWRDLLERHHAVVRRELKAFGGREMDTSGDGFFAVFESPERAVRCAESIIASVAGLGLRVRAGVHMGECELIDGKVGGMGVVIGARIGALADAGEVLVSSSVRDLMTGSDRRFEGGAEHTLKGVDEPWRVYRLVPGEAADVPAQRRPAPMMPVYTRRQRWRLVVAAAAVLALVLALAGGYVLTRTEPEVVVGENAVGVIEGGRATDAVQVGERPSGIAVGADAVWVSNFTDDTVSRIDGSTHAAFTIPVGSAPAGVAVGAGAVWVANSGDGTVSRIDPHTNRVKNISVLPGPTGLVVAEGSVWVTNTLAAAVTQIDPRTSKVVNEPPVGANPTGIAYGAGSLWVTNQSDGTVTRLDPSTLRIEDSISVGRGPVGIAVADGAAWVANNLDGSVSRIDVDDNGHTSRTIDPNGGAYGIAAAGHDVWVTSEYAGTISQVDTREFELVRTVATRGAPLGVAVSGDRVWFASAGAGKSLHRGGILRVAAEGLGGGYLVGDPPVVDPATAYDEQLWRLLAMTNDGLVGYRRTGGIDGALLVPDLATALPTPGDGGLTYTFRLRRDVRYSTGELVRPEDIRRGIERLLELGQGPSSYFTVIRGARRCLQAPRTCDVSAGIVADDSARTITFRLTRPSPDFLRILALSGAYATPAETPVRLSPGSVLPATGPYMIQTYDPGPTDKDGQASGPGRIELVRNPYFREWSGAAQPAGYPDRIVFDTGLSQAEAVRNVVEGRADVVWQGVSDDRAPGLQAEYPTQLHTVPGIFMNYVYLNTAMPPFDNRDARQAVAYALNRRDLAEDPRVHVPGRTTCQVLPPDFPGYEPYCPYTLPGGERGEWTAPDVSQAEELLEQSGTKGARVAVAVLPLDRSTGHQLVELLRSLDYHVSFRVIPGNKYYWQFTQMSRIQVGVQGWGADSPGLTGYLTDLVSCGVRYPEQGFNLSDFCDVKIQAQIDEALKTQITNQADATHLWAQVDRAVVDAAPIIPFSNEIRHDFVSPRVGNYQHHPQYGLLPAQMYVN